MTGDIFSLIMTICEETSLLGVTILNAYQYYRKRSGLKQSEVADALNIDRTTVAKWECEKAYPTANKLKPLANLYNCTVDELLSENVASEQNN